MMAKPWKDHRDTITRLYIAEGRTLHEVRGIMKAQFNFEASVRSYRQHFDNWGIGKYNCKKRQMRRQSLGGNALPTPPHSPPEGRAAEASEGGSSPSSSCGSQRSPEQRPLPELPSRHSSSSSSSCYERPYTAVTELPFRERSHPRIKSENRGGGPMWEGMDLYRNTPPVSHSMLPPCMPFHPYSETPGWTVPRGTHSSYLVSPSQDCYSSGYPPRNGSIHAVLRSPNLIRPRLGREHESPGGIMHHHMSNGGYQRGPG